MAKARQLSELAEDGSSQVYLGFNLGLLYHTFSLPEISQKQYQMVIGR